MGARPPNEVAWDEEQLSHGKSQNSPRANFKEAAGGKEAQLDVLGSHSTTGDIKEALILERVAHQTQRTQLRLFKLDASVLAYYRVGPLLKLSAYVGCLSSLDVPHCAAMARLKDRQK